MASADQSVYVAVSADGLCKVGVSQHPQKRRSQIAASSGQRVAMPYVSAPTPDARLIEAAAHLLLEASHHLGEWFSVTPEAARSAIENAAAAVAAGYIPDRHFCGPGRPSLGVKFTAIRLTPDMLARIDKVAGDKRRSAFIREAVEEKLTAVEAELQRTR